MCECCTPKPPSHAPVRSADDQQSGGGGGCGCSGACGCGDIGQRSVEVHGVEDAQRERQPQLVALQITGA